MKLLKADANLGHFLKEDGEFDTIDQITKEDLLRLAELTLEQDEIEFDAYDEDVIKNEAHRIIYRNILEKLEDLRERRVDFHEQSEGLYREACEQYRQDASGGNGPGDAGPPTQKKATLQLQPAKKPLGRSNIGPHSGNDIPF